MKESSKKLAADRRRRDDAKAVGAIIAFYRRTRAVTQMKLTEKAGKSLSASSLAMIEGGYRLPSDKALKLLADRLHLSPYQMNQLQSLTRDANRTDEEKLQTITPSDVLHGIPLFLRPPGDDSLLLEGANVEAVWIVTKMPLTASGSYYEMLRRRLTVGKTSFTYFLDSDTGTDQFEAIYRKLLGDPEFHKTARERLHDRLNCILVPPTLTVFGYVLFNPGVAGRMFGRSVVMDENGITIGVIPMDPIKVGAAYSLLGRINNQLCQLSSRSKSSLPQDVPGIGNCELVAVSKD